MIRILRYLIMLLAAVLVGTSPARGADVRSVVGSATFYGHKNQGPDECRRLALQQARIAALAAEFGTNVSNVILTRGNADAERAMLMSETEVKGEWIADEGEPDIKIEFDNDYNIVVHCTVRGKARPISNEATQFQAEVTRNGIDPSHHAATRFATGDQMFLWLKTPCEGYVAVMLLDADNRVFRLLPYPASTLDRVKIKGNKSYVFFDDTRLDQWQQRPAGMLMATDKEGGEWNRLYVIFSPEAFGLPPAETDASGIPSMSYDDFSRWLIKARRHDPKMGQLVFNLEIVP